MSKGNRFTAQVWKYTCNAFRLIRTSPKDLELNELVRKRLYTQYAGLLIGLWTAGIVCVVFLHIYEMILFMLLLLAAFLFYVLSTEFQFGRGEFIEHIAKCVEVTPMRQKGSNPLCTYQFEGTEESDGITIFINRTENIGFLKNATYYLCFKAKGSDTVSGENLIGSIQLQ